MYILHVFYASGTGIVLNPYFRLLALFSPYSRLRWLLLPGLPFFASLYSVSSVFAPYAREFLDYYERYLITTIQFS